MFKREPPKFKDKETEEQYWEWYNSRPLSVQNLMDIWYPLDLVLFNCKKYYVIGWTEDNKIIVTKVDPSEDYDEAIKEENKEYICASHLTLLPPSPSNN